MNSPSPTRSWRATPTGDRVGHVVGLFGRNAVPNVNTLLDEHVVLKYECLDRLFLRPASGLRSDHTF